jgi:Coenzyme PQQ synthesis protein D (PqqD)
MNIKISDNVVWRDLDGEIVILNLTSGVYFSVDGVGTRIWTLMAEQVATEEIVRRLISEFEVEEAQLRSDMESLVKDLAGQGLIEVSG